ncbi:MAG: DUF2807 domain-containing protein [Bacteroidales bacterium]|nr:DUF2807 domain-containing protein [Bacteroidales bacterium]
MRKIIGIIIAVVLSVTIAKADSAETRYLTDFNSVYLFGNMTVRLVKSDSTYVVLKGDSAAFSKVSTKIKSEELTVKFTKMGNEKTITVVVFYKNIDKIIGKAGVTVVANTSINTDKFEIKLTQGSDAILELNIDNLDVKVNQGSTITLKGKVQNLGLVSNTGAYFYGKKLNVVNANLKAATGGQIRIKLSGDVEASASTSGDIYYWGTPKTISQSASSGGEIIQNK